MELFCFGQGIGFRLDKPPAWQLDPIVLSDYRSDYRQPGIIKPGNVVERSMLSSYFLYLLSKERELLCVVGG